MLTKKCFYGKKIEKKSLIRSKTMVTIVLTKPTIYLKIRVATLKMSFFEILSFFGKRFFFNKSKSWRAI